jgi:hypothetical protein
MEAVSKPKEVEKEQQPDFALAAIAEMLFIVLPLIVLGLVFLVQGKTWFLLLSSPEWSFGAAVLMRSLKKLAKGERHGKVGAT